MLTGNLKTRIKNTFPSFKGTEAHYLKCQIVRVSFSTQIVPADIYTTNDEDASIIEIDPEAEWKGTEEMINSTENWVHLNPEILKVGRVKHEAPAGLDEDGRDEYIAKMEEDDPVTERLRALTEDEPYGEEREPWVIRRYGD